MLSASRFPQGEVHGAVSKKKSHQKNQTHKKTQNKKKPKPKKHQHLPPNPTAILKPRISFLRKNAQYIWLWPEFPILEAKELCLM